MKDSRQEMVEPIYDIIKFSLKTGKVPKEWKRADIMAIYKNGNKEEPRNHRPVSLTSIVCKVCEKVIKKQRTEYFETEGIRNDNINNLDSEQEGLVSPSY